MTSIVVLLLVWTALFAVVPRLSVIATRLLAPAPSDQAFAQEKAQIPMANERPARRRMDKLIKEYPRPNRVFQFGKPDPWPPKEFSGQAGGDPGAFPGRALAATGRAQQAFEKKRDAQIQLSMLAARISPVSCYVRPMAELAGTGWLEYKRFTETVGRFQKRLNDEIQQERLSADGRRRRRELHGENGRAAAAPGRIRIPASDVASDVLAGLYPAPSLQRALLRGAFAAFLRYDPR